MELQQLVDRIASEVTPGGAVADYIPALARIDPHAFGLAVATLDGEVFGAGDYDRPFSIQSISKAFMLALALAENDDVWTRVGREPSGSPFNSLVQLETEQGIPRNPFINAGAVVVTDHLGLGAADRLLGFLRQESGNPAIDVDPEVAKSELDHGDRNRALAHFMASYGNMRNPVDTVVHEYVRQCSIAMSCADLARATLFLARHGVRNDGTRLLGVSGAKRVNAVMLTCGTYDAMRPVRLSRRPARQERRRRRDHRRGPREMRDLRLESSIGRARQLRGGCRRAGPFHHSHRLVRVLTDGRKTG